jgi:hypothetical protein
MRIRTLLTTASAMALSFGVMAGAAQANNNQLVVDQIGNYNFDDAGQSGNNNETLVRQTTSNNTASVSTGGFPSFREDIAVLQKDGTANYVAAGTDGGGTFDNDFGVIQEGGRNTASFDQEGSVSDRNNTEIGVVQTGNQNVVAGGAGFGDNQGGGTGTENRGFGAGTVTYTQTGISFTQESEDELMLRDRAPVTGSGHFIAIEQDGFQNVVGLEVRGNGNSILGVTASNMNASGRSALNLNKDFGSSVFDGGETIDADARNTGSSVTGGFFIQNGNFNQAALKQDGVNNTIAAGQIGSNNTMEITQVGTGNFHMGGQID